MKGCLAAGYPFVLGFTVYESFESDAVARTGKPGPQGIAGGGVSAGMYNDKGNAKLVGSRQLDHHRFNRLLPQ